MGAEFNIIILETSKKKHKPFTIIIIIFIRVRYTTTVPNVRLGDVCLGKCACYRNDVNRNFTL